MQLPARLSALVAGVTVCSCMHARATTLEPTDVQRSRDRIAIEEIVTAKGIATAYDAIVQLRPEFLTPRRQLTTPELRTKQGADELLNETDGRFPAVYINGALKGAPGILRTIRVETVIEICRYPSGHVPTRYGINNPGGVVDVRTRPEGRESR